MTSNTQMSQRSEGGAAVGDKSELVSMAKRILDGNRYMTIATVGEAAGPWATPVYFSHGDYRDMYWISSPDAEHSQNIASRPDVSLVVFDSTVPIGGAEAVYMKAQAHMVAEPTPADQSLNGASIVVSISPASGGPKTPAPRMRPVPESILK